MDLLESKFAGTWLQDEVTGDITDWLKLEGVGMVMRQAMWLTGYGKGKVNLSMILKDGTMYNLSELDENFARFRFQFKLDGKKHPFLFAEGVPFMAFRNFCVQATMTSEGVIEAAMFNDKDEMHSKSSRCVTDDGDTLSTDITFFGDREINVSIKHKRVERSRLALDECSRWCPNMQVGDASAEAGQEKASAVTVALDSLFRDAPELFDMVERVKRQVEEGGADTMELSEASPTEFTMAVTKADGAKETFVHRLDKAAGKIVVDYAKDGKDVGSWHLKVLKEPLRMECWCTLSDKFVSTVCALTELQNTLDKALRLKCGS